MKHLAVLALSLSALTAQADELIISGVSKHLNPDQPMHEVNPGLGYRADFRDRKVQLGFYKNSYDRLTVYVATDLASTQLTPRLNVKLLAGAATGYSRRGARPMVLPTLSYRLSERWVLDTVVVPPIAGAAIIACELRFDLR